MSDDEKKFKLDELPDLGSEPTPKKLLKKTPNKPLDPRVQNLKKKDDKARVEAMVQTWNFDKPDFSFLWVPWALTIAIAEWTGYFGQIESQLETLKDNPFTMGSGIFIDFLAVGAVLFDHPIVLLLLFPLIFRLRKPSDFYFEIKFDGISTVRKFLAHGSKEQVFRTFVKWDSIAGVQKVNVNDKEILRLTALDGHIADIIWYIDIDKKRALKLLLSGMITPKHPLRVFLDQEKELS